MVESVTVVTRFVPGAASTSAIGSWVKQATWSVSVGSVHGADAVGDGSGSGGEYARARYVMVDGGERTRGEDGRGATNCFVLLRSARRSADSLRGDARIF